MFRARLACQALLVGVALLLAAGTPAQALSIQDTFPIEIRTYYLTQDVGAVPNTTVSDVQLLSHEPGDASSPTPSFNIPLLEGLGLATDTYAWYGPNTFEHDLIVIGATQVELHFSVQANGDLVINAELLEVAPNGDERVLGKGSRTVSVQSTLPQAEIVTVDTDQAAIREGHTLGLRVVLDGISGFNTLMYGSADAPSQVRSLPTAILDSDQDGIGDSDERRHGWDENDPKSPGDGFPDRDRDGLSNQLEGDIGTNPDNPDTDGDGFPDGTEYFLGTDPLDPASRPVDTDRDCLPDEVELDLRYNPNDPDTDGDGISDGDEDFDGDGASNCLELRYGTRLDKADTDEDGTSDYIEITVGSNARLDPADLVDGFAYWEVVTGGGLSLAAAGTAVFALTRRYGL